LDLCDLGYGLVAGCCEPGNETSVSIKDGNFLNSWVIGNFLRTLLFVVSYSVNIYAVKYALTCHSFGLIVDGN
jgi:hypothetical protein